MRPFCDVQVGAIAERTGNPLDTEFMGRRLEPGCEKLFYINAPSDLMIIVDRAFSRSCVMSWERPFDQPVPLPGERPARTLRDAGNYISKLPVLERNMPEWRLAVQMLIDAAEDRGPMLFAKIGMDRALNPDRKDPHWGKRKLKRDE